MPRLFVPAADTAQRDDEFETLPAQTSSDEPSAINILPSDVLSLIFQYTCDPILPFDGRYHYPDSTSLLQTLSLVSKHWYGTLMETSDLWTSITMSMEGADTSKYATGLASFFKKTRYRSLSLSLDFSGLFLNLDDDNLLHPSIDAIILKNLERIENLQLVKPPRAWFYRLHHLSRIDHLSLYQVEGDPVHLSLDRLPSLSKFTLVNGNIRLASPCLITSLTLIGVPLNTCFNLVTHCPKLIKLHLEDYITSGQHMLDDNLPISEAFMPQQRLEVLIWKIFSTHNFITPWQTVLLNHITVNSLQTLTWHQPPNWTLQEFPSGQAFRTAIHNFYARLSTKLTCIEFIENYDSTWRTESRFMEYLQNDQGIDSLKFSECNTGFIMSFLENLTSSSSSNRFPRLNTITIGKIHWSNPRNINLDKRFEKMLAERFLEMVKGRLKPMEGRLALCMEDDSLYREEDGSNCAWLNHIEQEMMELKSCGYQIEIFIASKPEEYS